jgi:hypothetical protein
MTTKFDIILAALSLAIGVPRNEPIKDFTGTFVALRDGDIEQTEEFINGPIYEFTGRPAMVLAVEGGTTVDRDTALAALIADYDTALEAAKSSLAAAGLITDLRVLAPDRGANDLWGAVGVKTAELPIEIDYWSDRPVG